MIKPIPQGGIVVGLLLVKLLSGLASLPKERGLEQKLCRVSGDKAKTIIPLAVTHHEMIWSILQSSDPSAPLLSFSPDPKIVYLKWGLDFGVGITTPGIGVAR